MSRIGKKPIDLPKETQVSVSGGFITVKGPLGVLTRAFPSVLSLEVTSSEAKVMQKINSASALWGTYSSHLKNMVAGVNKPFQKKLIVEGVGFRAEVKGADLVMNLGFSHQIKVALPKDIKVTAEKNVITISGPDKERVGQFAAVVREYKKPEPYKGKGIRYDGEFIRRKEGKKTV